jgi:eukaryotic-like serine/threonine-protein kinase
MTHQTDLDAGQILGRYELLAPVAKGGTALIWVARVAADRDSTLVAVKTLLEADEHARLMSRDEAALTTAIRHENVARLLDTGEYAGMPFLVMEWIDGEPLDVILQYASRGGGLPIAIAVDLVRQACEGLHAAHELRGADGELRGLVHRDISPQNVMVTCQGTVKLVDFGIAKATQRSSHTQLGQIKGKIAYMAPEQVRGTAVDRRTDVFAMGVVLYLLTTGRHPFKARTPAETIRRICFAGPPPPPSSLVENYPAALEPIVMKALSSDLDSRPATALELSTELAEVAGDLGARPDVGAFLRELLADRIHERRLFIEDALAAADERYEAREASTVPPPRSKAPSRKPPTLNPPSEESLGAFSSLQALVVSGRAPAAASEATGVRPILFSNARRRGIPLIALASALAAACVFSLAVTHEPANSRVVYTTLGAPQRLVADTLNALRPTRHD